MVHLSKLREAFTINRYVKLYETLELYNKMLYTFEEESNVKYFEFHALVHILLCILV